MKEISTFACGCFWCSEAIFRRLRGVISVMPGYSGGKKENPALDYAESIQITFDPSQISYLILLDVFWKLHDPTTLNRQEPDIGKMYRSIIFYHNREQKKMAEEGKLELEESGYYKDKIVTEIVPFTNFYPAQAEHKDFYERNRDSLYCQVVIDPKIQKLMKEFNQNVAKES